MLDQRPLRKPPLFSTFAQVRACAWTLFLYSMRLKLVAEGTDLFIKRISKKRLFRCDMDNYNASIGHVPRWFGGAFMGDIAPISFRTVGTH